MQSTGEEYRADMSNYDVIEIFSIFSLRAHYACAHMRPRKGWG